MPGVDTGFYVCLFRLRMSLRNLSSSPLGHSTTTPLQLEYKITNSVLAGLHEVPKSFPACLSRANNQICLIPYLSFHDTTSSLLRLSHKQFTFTHIPLLLLLLILLLVARNFRWFWSGVVSFSVSPLDVAPLCSFLLPT
jgi:hypothetical protein